jgi:hypothetical protein
MRRRVTRFGDLSCPRLRMGSRWKGDLTWGLFLHSVAFIRESWGWALSGVSIAPCFFALVVNAVYTKKRTMHFILR